MKTQPYYYNRQIERYLIQFANIFSGFQVKIGTGDREQMVSVPVMYGSLDKVVASIHSGNTQNKPIRLPVISTFMTGIDLASELYRGVGQEDRFSYLPSGGILPNDIKVLHRYMPIPYKLTCEVYTYCSNQVQQLQLLEQLLVLFDPTMVLQTSDSKFDWTKLTSVELTNILLEETIPAGDSDRVIISRLQFEFPIWISPPAKSKNNEFVEQIMIRMNNLDELLQQNQTDIDGFLNGDAITSSFGRGSVLVTACEPNAPDGSV